MERLANRPLLYTAASIALMAFGAGVGFYNPFTGIRQDSETKNPQLKEYLSNRAQLESLGLGLRSTTVTLYDSLFDEATRKTMEQKKEEVDGLTAKLVAAQTIDPAINAKADSYRAIHLRESAWFVLGLVPFVSGIVLLGSTVKDSLVKRTEEWYDRERSTLDRRDFR